MESFVFNSFKTRLMNGEVELSGSYWKHYPVNKKFVENYEDDIKSLSSTSAFIMYDLAKNKASIIYDSAKNTGYKYNICISNRSKLRVERTKKSFAQNSRVLRAQAYITYTQQITQIPTEVCNYRII